MRSFKLVAAVVITWALSVSVLYSRNIITEAGLSLDRNTLHKADTLNPVIPGDFADPSVIRFGDSYYAAGTSSEWAPHFPIYKSPDLINWTLIGHIFPEKQSWMSSSFWAPELYVHNGQVYAYYTVRDTNNISCIGVATAQTPETPFKDHGVIIRTGKEAIDAFVFRDSGQLYVSWKAYGLDKRPIELLSSKMTPDGLGLTGDIVTIAKDVAGKGMEGQSMIRHNGYYYLFYSAGSCCGVPCSYNVRVSRSRSLNGPFEEYAMNPVLKEGGDWMCTGHGTPVQMADGRWFYLFHAYNKESNVFTGRQGMVAEISWNNEGWPTFNLPKATSGSGARPKSWKADLNSKRLDLRWSWDYRHASIHASSGKGQLRLSGESINGSNGGHVLALRTSSASYEVITRVANLNSSLKGVVLYGDYDNQAGIGIQNDSVQVWTIRKNIKKIISQQKINKPTGTRLKMIVAEGHNLEFFYSSDGKQWNSIAHVDADFTRQWDRAPRPGLIHAGAEDKPALFSEFIWKDTSQ